MQKKRHFVKGDSALRQTETDYMAAMLETVTVADWTETIASTVEDAKSGDFTARNCLAQ